MLLIDHRETESGNAMMILPRGPLSTETAPVLAGTIESLAREKGHFVIMEASGLEYASSAGIGMMLHAHRSLVAEGGGLVVCNLPEETLSLFKLIGFDRILNIAGSVEESERIIAELKAEKPAARTRISEVDNARPEAKMGETETDQAVVEEPIVQGAPTGDDFDRALVIECSECGGLVRVRRSGSYQCPHCRTEFTVEMDQTIIF